MIKLFNGADSFTVQANALLLRGERQSVLAGNIANAETPNFKARDFNFNQALNQALGQSVTFGKLPMTQSQVGHLASQASALPVALNYRQQATENIDGNTIDMDQERAQFADNTMRYEAALRQLNNTIKTLQSAISNQ